MNEFKNKPINDSEKNLHSLMTGNKSSIKSIGLIKESKEVVSKSMRIYEKDFKRVKEMAYRDDKTMVEIVEEAVEMLYKSRNYDK